jgi:hypothetical protein
MEWIPVAVIVAISIGTALWYALRQPNPAEASQHPGDTADTHRT